jgi:hypothetical protein
MEDWDKDGNGEVTIDPLLDFDAVTVMEMGIALRLVVAHRADGTTIVRSAVQIGLTHAQALRFALTLRALADSLLSGDPERRPS